MAPEHTHQHLTPREKQINRDVEAILGHNIPDLDVKRKDYASADILSMLETFIGKSFEYAYTLSDEKQTSAELTARLAAVEKERDDLQVRVDELAANSKAAIEKLGGVSIAAPIVDIEVVKRRTFQTPTVKKVAELAEEFENVLAYGSLPRV